MKYSRKNRRYDDVLAEIHDSFTEEEYYDALYYILGDSYPDASEEELEEIFEEMLENMSEQQAEDFMSSLGSIGKKIGSGLAQVPNFLGKNPELLSTIGGIAGNLILPGAGGMIGGALGSAAGGLLQNKNAQNNLQQQQQNPNAIVNPDAAKLNSLMQDPQMQRALMQMSTSNVPIAPLTSNGQTTHVPIANFLHALIRQAQAALQQLDALIPPQVQEALAENFGEDFAGEDLGEALLEEVRVNGGWEEEEKTIFDPPTNSRDNEVYPPNNEIPETSSGTTALNKLGYTVTIQGTTIQININIILASSGAFSITGFTDIANNFGLIAVQRVITNNLNAVYHNKQLTINSTSYTTNLSLKFIACNSLFPSQRQPSRDNIFPNINTAITTINGDISKYPNGCSVAVTGLPTSFPDITQATIYTETIPAGTCLFVIGLSSNVPSLGGRTVFLSPQDFRDCDLLRGANGNPTDFGIAHEFAHLFGLDDRYWYYQVLWSKFIVPFGMSSYSTQYDSLTRNFNARFVKQIPIYIATSHDSNYETNNNLLSNARNNSLTPFQWSIIANTGIVENLPIESRMRTVFSSKNKIFRDVATAGRVLSICMERVTTGGVTDGDGGSYNPPMKGQIRIRCKERVMENNSLIERYITNDGGTNQDNEAIIHFEYWGHPLYPKRCSSGKSF